AGWWRRGSSAHSAVVRLPGALAESGPTIQDRDRAGNLGAVLFAPGRFFFGPISRELASGPIALGSLAVNRHPAHPRGNRCRLETEAAARHRNGRREAAR